MPEDNLNNCDPPIIIPPNTVDPGQSGGSGSGGGGTGVTPSRPGTSGGYGGGNVGGSRPPSRPPNSTNDGGAVGSGSGSGGSGGSGGGGAGGALGGGANLNCTPFSGPSMQTNSGKGWGETPTQYGKIKGKKIEAKKNDCGCEGSDGEGDNEAERFKDVTIYPFNKVTETESGHVVEFDDTPGSERISTNHRSGTFEEYHPNGDKVVKVVRDSYTSVFRDSHVHIDGYSNVTIDKALKIFVNKDELESSEESAVNFDIHIGKNANVNIYIEKGNLNVLVDEGDSNIQLKKGDVNIRQDCGHYNHFVNGDYNLECTGHMHMVVGEDQVTEVGGNRDTRVDGDFDNLVMTKKGSKKETKVYDLGQLVQGRAQEYYLNSVEREYGAGGSEQTVKESYKFGAERTYSGAGTVESHQSLCISTGNNTGTSTGALLIGDLSISTERSIIRTAKENILMSQTSVQLQGHGGVIIDCGNVEGLSKNKQSILSIHSQGQAYIGSQGMFNISSRKNINIMATNNVTLYSGSKLYKNKEFEDGGNFQEFYNEVYSNIKVINPELPVKFIECPPAKWIPTKQKESCKSIN